MHQVRKDVLNGWKEIGAYLGRDPRTVERWEKQRLLPVRRLPGKGRATVYALVSELDSWLSSSPMREMPAAAVSTEATAVAEPGGADAGAVVEDRRQLGAQGTGPQHAEPHPLQHQGRGGQAFRDRWPVWAVAVLVAAVVMAGLWAVARPRAGRSSHGLEGATGEREQPVASSPVPGVEQLYLRGCYQTELRTPEALRRAQDDLGAAIQKDPNYAPAFAGLANVFLLSREYAMVPDAEAFANARRAAERALALDGHLAGAHAAMGFVLFFGGWDVAASEREFTLALRLDPKLALAHHWYGSALLHQGRFRESLEELTLAQRLDPSSSAILTTRAFALAMQERRDEAEDLLEDAVRAERGGRYRNPATMHQVLGTLSLLPPRNPQRFLGESLLAAQLRQDAATVNTLQMAAAALQRHGERGMWQALLEKEQLRHHDGERTYAMARYEAALGDREGAMRDLDHAYARHEEALMGISVDPLLADLAGERRFQSLRMTMGMSAIAHR